MVVLQSSNAAISLNAFCVGRTLILFCEGALSTVDGMEDHDGLMSSTKATNTVVYGIQNKYRDQSRLATMMSLLLRHANNNNQCTSLDHVVISLKLIHLGCLNDERCPVVGTISWLLQRSDAGEHKLVKHRTEVNQNGRNTTAGAFSPANRPHNKCDALTLS